MLRRVTTPSRRLQELGLWRKGGRFRSLPAACHAGRLVGGLSVDLRATPDEVVGALCDAMGGGARGLRVEDVRGGPPLELHVRTPEGLERWAVEGVEGLVHNLNDLFRADAAARPLAVLGEHEDMLQLWCVDRLRLTLLLGERWFEAKNLEQLRGILLPGAAF